MLSDYKIEYGIPLGARIERHCYRTDDPVACEQFLVNLLEKGFKIHAIYREGSPLGRAEFNRMVKTAANMLAAEYICASLDIDTAQERFEFGFTG